MFSVNGWWLKFNAKTKKGAKGIGQTPQKPAGDR